MPFVVGHPFVAHLFVWLERLLDAPPLTLASVTALVLALACIGYVCPNKRRAAAEKAPCDAEVAPVEVSPRLQLAGRHCLPEGAAERALALEPVMSVFSRPTTAASWREVYSSPQLRISHHFNGHRHAVRITTSFDVGVDVLVAIAREIDLLPGWNRFVLFSQILEEYSGTSVRAGARLWTPFPLQNIASIVNASLYDLLDSHGCFLLLTASPEHTPGGAAPPPLPAELSGLWAMPNEGQIRYAPRPGGGCDVTIVNFVESSLLPSWVLSLILFSVVPSTLRATRTMLAEQTQPGAVLAERMASSGRSELYSGIRARCAEHLAAKAVVGASAAGAPATPLAPAADGAGASAAQDSQAALDANTMAGLLPRGERPPIPADSPVGKLLAEHAAAIAELRALLSSEDGFDPAEHDELHLLRFLLSHALSPRRAARAFTAGMHWRREHDIDSIRQSVLAGLPQSGFDGFRKIHRNLPYWILTGAPSQPAVFVSAAEVNLDALMAETTLEEYVRYMFFFNEYTAARCDAATRRTGRLVKVVRLIDARGLGLRHLNVRFYQAVAAAARGSENAYPQLLGAFFLANAGPTLKLLWERTLVPLIPKRVLEKSHVIEPLTSAADRAKLATWLPAHAMPVQVGGELRLQRSPAVSAE